MYSPLPCCRYSFFFTVILALIFTRFDIIIALIVSSVSSVLFLVLFVRYGNDGCRAGIESVAMILAIMCMSSVAFPQDDFPRSQTDIAESVIALLAWLCKISIVSYPFRVNKLTRHMVTASFLFNAMSTLWIRAFLGDSGDQFFRRCFLLHPLLALKIILGTCLAFVPGHLVCEASFELADGTGHDRLSVSCFVNLSRITAGAKTHSKVWHIPKCCKKGFLIESVNRGQVKSPKVGE
jgi:hypothetical protein